MVDQKSIRVYLHKAKAKHDKNVVYSMYQVSWENGGKKHTKSFSTKKYKNAQELAEAKAESLRTQAPVQAVKQTITSKKPDAAEVAAQLKAYQQDKGLSNNKLAAALGVTYPTIQKLREGTAKYLRNDTVHKLQKLFGSQEQVAVKSAASELPVFTIAMLKRKINNAHSIQKISYNQMSRDMGVPYHIIRAFAQGKTAQPRGDFLQSAAQYFGGTLKGSQPKPQVQPQQKAEPKVSLTDAISQFLNQQRQGFQLLETAIAAVRK